MKPHPCFTRKDYQEFSKRDSPIHETHRGVCMAKLCANKVLRTVQTLPMSASPSSSSPVISPRRESVRRDTVGEGKARGKTVPAIAEEALMFLSSRIGGV